MSKFAYEPGELEVVMPDGTRKPLADGVFDDVAGEPDDADDGGLGGL